MKRRQGNGSVFRLLMALVLVVAGVFCLGVTSRSALAAAVLGDVSGHWAETYVNQMVEQGILTGYPDGTFRPDNSISREEFAAVLARAKGLKAPDTETQYFADVGPDNWSYGNIQALAHAGIVHPEDYDGKLQPGTPITRVEIATMLVRAAGLEGEVAKKGSLVSFKDSIPSWAKGYVTVALNHGLVTGYDDGTFRAQGKATRAEAGLMVLRMLDPKVRPATWVERYTYPGKTGTNTLKVVRVNFNRDDIEIRPGIAGTLRENAYLEDIALKEGAIAAVNGGYFSAYGGADFREPFNALVIDGKWQHLQYQGTCLGITRDKRIIMDPIRMTIYGSTNGVWGEWTAWQLNHTASNMIAMFTPLRGKTTNMTDGITFTVRGGRVVSKGGPDVEIPEDGYVIFVSNSRIDQWTDMMFPIGGVLDFKMRFWDHKDVPYPNTQDWQQILHAIGCGPRMVTSGRVTVNPIAENYTEAKQTTMSYNRSGVGVTSDNIVMFVTCTSLTPQEFGEAMLDLGSYNAMQMDSGGSSGLWYDGEYLTGPGRMINNALCVIQKTK